LTRSRRAGKWTSTLGLCIAAAAAGLAVLIPLTTSSHGGTTVLPPGILGTDRAAGSVNPPVYAYFYQWFTDSSWLRAKQDYPLVGRYSSDSSAILRTQVHEAREAGINGFLTSWKDTPELDRRLERLVRVATEWHFDVGVVYEALDFNRNPLPITTVERDLRALVDRWGGSLRSRYFGRPLIIWTGTNDYSRSDISKVRDVLDGRATLLAASKSADDYTHIADLVDGDAYYWSSANPASSITATKLNEMGAVVHAHHGIWLAPAAPGFDGRTLGHTRVVPRLGGGTLRRSLAEAYRSKPDAVGVISWNEWSENTYIEPGKRYGAQELDALRDYLAARPGSPLPSSAGQSHGGWSGLIAAGTLGGVSVLALVITWARSRRGRRERKRSRHQPALAATDGPLEQLDSRTTADAMGRRTDPSTAASAPPGRR
jgi:hypothetical protein